MKLEVNLTKEEAVVLLNMVVNIPLQNEPVYEDALGKLMNALDYVIRKDAISEGSSS